MKLLILSILTCLIVVISNTAEAEPSCTSEMKVCEAMENDNDY